MSLFAKARELFKNINTIPELQSQLKELEEMADRQARELKSLRHELQDKNTKQTKTLEDILAGQDASADLAKAQEEKLQRIHEEICTLDNAAKLILLGVVMDDLDEVNDVKSKENLVRRSTSAS